MVWHSSVRVIEGRHHPLVKEIRRIIRSGELLSTIPVHAHRPAASHNTVATKTQELLLLETVRLVEDALSGGLAIPKVLISRNAGRRARSLVDQLRLDTDVYVVTQDVFESLTSTDTSQGILALAAAPRWQETDLFERQPESGQPALTLVVAGVQDPGNLGAIIRTAEALGATGILLTKGTVSPYNAKVVRAAAGALLRVPMIRDLTVTEAIALLARYHIPLFAAIAEGGKRLPTVHFQGPVGLAVGSEGAGLPKQLVAAGERITIPIASAVESLNVAAATAVILYEIARQRSCHGSIS